MTETDWTPLFLLRTVLFPKALLGLRIFEPRYLDMISASLRQGRDFGICLSHSWSDGHAEPELVGTLARIVDWGGEAGVLQIRVQGQERFTIQEWRYDGPLAVAVIHRWAAEPIVPMRRESDVLRSILEELVGKDSAAEMDASSAGMILAQALPASPEEKQQLLILQDPLERLRRIMDLLNQRGA
ncbi:LON peptidase substrate-binding domain-containing protein [Acidithiobacillus sp.]|uniref:LON peptidase substrate-binding domain-containing protein n=1 Tax=Acidithiobacillus sp. TaxID=1872118 RepID=UPI0025BAD7CC|nr:LON peptidase substrate-binding domain-containing protein [Acidithiobacillus sp.]MCK9189049.1 LON peptidase substrate-binding domain-containing protein [Acidithiobacillus sp.]MCK9359290.1 LON peptidase substrate-binding domain-containing protein [Acidithiobacillus sp.]